LLKSIAVANEQCFAETLAKFPANLPYRYDPKDVGERKLRFTLLSYLTSLDKKEYFQQALDICKSATNLTEEIGGLGALIHRETTEREQSFDHFYQKWNQETLVMNKWLALQAASSVPGGLDRVKRLMKDPVFNINNPNKVYSLLGSFGRGNLTQFHAKDGAAYRFFADLVMDIDSRNPTVSARMVSFFNQWKRFDQNRQSLMKAELERIVAKAGISNGVFEIASKALQ
jgi:aminopeptidase N